MLKSALLLLGVLTSVEGSVPKDPCYGYCAVTPLCNYNGSHTYGSYCKKNPAANTAVCFGLYARNDGSFTYCFAPLDPNCEKQAELGNYKPVDCSAFMATMTTGN
jgi:hypothetical protein